MALRPPSLGAIAALEAAARHQSFTRAAAELNLTPGAISHAIRGLERRLGFALFVRRGRRVALSDQGQVLVTRVRLSLQLLEDAFDPARSQVPERLIVSTLPSIADRILVPALGELEGAVPGTSLDLRCSNALVTFSGDADLAIRFGPGGWPGMESWHLADEWLIPVASPDYVADRGIRRIEDLGRCRLIAHPQSSWKLWLDPLGLREEQYEATLTIDDALVAVQAAASGLGVALARARLVSADLQSGRLVGLFDAAVSAEYSYWAVWNGSSLKRRRIEAFVDWTANLFSRRPPWTRSAGIAPGGP
jgi:LysR family transcriptional regulator, glycine cleavage system transcriptional activator